jgi:lipoprotein-releasing system permease protein
VSYELNIGWRYIYGGKRDRHMAIGAGISVLIAIVGLVLAATSSGSSPEGVITLVVGLLGTAVFTLLTFFSVFTSVSVLGVVLGVAALTVVMSVTTGFQEQFREKVLGVNAHIIIMKSANDFGEYGKVMATALAVDDEVVAAQPFIYAEMLVTNGKGGASGVAIKGVDPEGVRKVLDLEKHMVEGSVSALAEPAGAGVPAPIILGRELGRKLQVKVGDVITVVVPLSNLDERTWRAKSSAPRSRKFRVAGLFYSGFDEYDRRLMYTSLREAQALVDRGDQVLGVELKVKDVDHAKAIATKLSKKLGEPPYQVQDWYELNHNLFTALNLQKTVLVIILCLIIAVAMFNMVAALVMMVTDKTREIAILKSMGSTSWSVAKLFMLVGVAIGGVGALLGIALGVVTSHLVQAYGYRLDPRVYLIDRLPITIEPTDIALVAVVTLVFSLIATVFPAIKALALTPVEGFLYD